MTSSQPALSSALQEEFADSQPVTRSTLNALVATVVYADLFDYALTRDEVHRYLIGVPASRPEIDQALAQSLSRCLPISIRDSYITLAGREGLIETRGRRAATAAKLWDQALAWRDALARLPFIRMLAITGTLAVDNTEDDGDIDLFIVTSPGRVWLARAFMIGVVKAAAMRGVNLCPNYLVSERAIRVPDRNIFTAHELAQMVPVYGLDLYQRMMAANPWLVDYLPNSVQNTGRLNPASEGSHVGKRLAEAIFGASPFHLVEKWEMQRKSARFAQLKRLANIRGSEVDFGPDWCKGHFQRHGERTLREYYDRLRQLKIDRVEAYVS